MLRPMRSLTLLHGSMISSLAATLATQPSVTRFRYTMGVWPMSSATLFLMLAVSGSGVSVGAIAARGARRASLVPFG